MSEYLSLFAWHETANARIKSISFDPAYEAKLSLGLSLVGMQPPKATLVNARGHFTDMLFAPSVEHVISERMKDFLLEREGEHLEIHPVQLGGSSKKHAPYFHMNVLQLVDAFDWKRSDYELFPELGPKGDKIIRVLKRMEIDPEKTRGRRLFGMEHYVGTTFVHASLAEEMLAAGFTGFRAQPLRGQPS